MNTHVLILLATVLVISRGQYAETEVFVASGSVAVLPCVVYSPNAHSFGVHWKKAVGDSEPRTVWRRDKSGLEFRPVGIATPQAHCPEPNFGKGDFSLHIEGVKEEDGGLYLCIVEQSQVVTKKVMLRVVTVSYTPADVKEGDDLKMTCNITPRPDRVTTKWELNGSTYRTSVQTLTLNNVSQKESGTWSCLVRHKNKETKASASLQVQGILFPKYNHEAVYAELGSSVTLPCIFSEGLNVDTVFWKKVSSTTIRSFSYLPYFINTSSPAVKQWDKSYHIENVEEADQGVYMCSGKIKRTYTKTASVERSINLVIARVLSSSSSSGQKTLTCELSNTKYVTRYEWLRLDNGENGTQTMIPLQNSTSKILNVPKAEENNFGGWMCRFYDRQRLLGNVTYHQHMMSGLKGQNESGSSKKTIMVIGLGLLLILALLILLQMYKNHRRRKMILQYPAMETIVHLASNERERREKFMAREKERAASSSVGHESTSVIM